MALRLPDFEDGQFLLPWSRPQTCIAIALGVHIALVWLNPNKLESSIAATVISITLGTAASAPFDIVLSVNCVVGKGTAEAAVIEATLRFEPDGLSFMASSSRILI